MAPFESPFGRRCRSSVGWFAVAEFFFIGQELVMWPFKKFDFLEIGSK